MSSMSRPRGGTLPCLTPVKKIAALLLLAVGIIGDGGLLGHRVGATPKEALAAAGEQADSQAALRAVLDKAIKAAGGADKLNKLARVTCRAKGIAVFPVGSGKEQDISFTASLQGLDQCRLDALTAYNRENFAIAVFKREYKDLEGWLDRPVDIKAGSTLLPGAGFGHDLYAVRLAQWLVPLQDKAFELSTLGELKVGQRQTVGIKFGHKNGLYLDLFFDKETGLPAKAQMQVPVKIAGVENVILDEYFFDDYKEFEGIKHCTKFTFHRDGKKRLEVELSDITPQEKFDEKIFAKP